MSLIGLPETYRFAVFNQTGIALNSAQQPGVQGRRVRFDSTGTLSYEAAVFTFLSIGTTTSIAANSYVTGSTWSNTASAWLGGEFFMSAQTVSNASGNVVLYLEASPDGGTTWPSPASANGAGGGIVVAVIGFGSVANVASTASTARIAYFDL